jgi:hypothetical protein
MNCHSNFVRTQRDDITYLFDRESNVEIITFYETKSQSTLKKVGIKQNVSHTRKILQGWGLHRKFVVPCGHG